MSSAPAEKLLTAEEFAALPDDGRPKELVRGRVVLLNVPYPRHGDICSKSSGCWAVIWTATTPAAWSGTTPES
jgi:hypothetical protein